MPVRAIWWSYLLDLSERQVDPLPDVLRGLWEFMLPELLHGASHDDEGSIAPRSRLPTPDAEPVLPSLKRFRSRSGEILVARSS